ncbi:efflux RND transporter periplasmic adaptor subunit [Natranaerobius thermophilus]|uniref:Efflux transporter, RND family, MFP subunit n=1 Tax=Natranaerobius thermophilus (strain ATCC BAA-1301 / DSM 18059 / JW/NM-WN-LF) TaxID=457570 RepID=B2A6I1_NATTJ|nr:efflux RND transporter periplasmic adaptor subunit [Natranaerobius thermophilus]ACB85514.1 efflux transporter, RND family, MFP subunit [Natranaerobius thermophilus JW/NM-WN-LF]
MTTEQKNSKFKLSRNKLIVIGLAVLAIVSGYFIINFTGDGFAEEENSNVDKEQDHSLVDVKQVPRQNIEKTVTVSGNVEAADDRLVIPQASGEIETIHYEEGDKVSQDDILMEIDSEDARLQRQEAEAALDAARANLEEAEAGAQDAELVEAENAVSNAEDNLRQAEKELERIEEMHQEEFATDQQLEQAEMQYNNAKSQLESAEAAKDAVEDGARQEQLDALEAQVRQAETGVELAKRAEENSQVKAPASGTIVSSEFSEGEMAGAGEPAFMIMDQDTFQVTATAPASYVHQISVGDSTEIRIPALNENFQGEIQRIGEIPAEKGRNYPVEIAITEENNDLRTGMFAENYLVIERHVDVLAVPRSSLVEHNDEIGIYTVNQDSTIDFNVLELGISQEGYLQVVDGLQEDDVIVVGGQSEVVPGEEVKKNYLQEAKSSDITNGENHGGGN